MGVSGSDGLNGRKRGRVVTERENESNEGRREEGLKAEREGRRSLQPAAGCRLSSCSPEGSRCKQTVTCVSHPTRSRDVAAQISLLSVCQRTTV